MGVITTYTARRHDKEAIAHLLRTPFGGLLEDPGVGKTGQVLAAFSVLRSKRLIDKLIVVAPLGPVYETWPDEVSKWAFPFSVAVLHGSRKEELLAEDHDVYLINYDGLDWLAANFKLILKRKLRWWLVLDESTKVKHTKTHRFKVLAPLLPCFTRRSVLTGTPAPNGLENLFGQVYCVDLGERLGRYITQYRREFFYPGGYGGRSWILQPDAEEKIYERLDGLFYRVSDDVLDLPALHDVPLYTRIPPKALKVYTALEKEFVAELGDKRVITAVNAGVLSSKLRQAANGRVFDADGRIVQLHDEKIVAITDLVEQLQGNPLLVGFEFTADGHRLAAALEDAPVVDGGMSHKMRRAVFREFNAGKHPAVVCQNDTVAHGRNLQERCHNIALFGLTWNLETYKQFKKRVHRGGQKNRVTCHHVIARGSIEEVQWAVLKQKDVNETKLLNALKKRYLR